MCNRFVEMQRADLSSTLTRVNHSFPSSEMEPQVLVLDNGGSIIKAGFASSTNPTW